MVEEAPPHSVAFQRGLDEAIFLFALILSTSAVSAQGTEMRDVAYGVLPLQRLDVCRPSDGPTALHAAVIMIHGGGLISGDKEGFRGLCLRASKQGLVAIALNYRLADGRSENYWPAQIEDVRAASAWIVEHATLLGADPARTCVLGDSSGSQLALDLGLSGKPFKTRCIVDQYGPVDLVSWRPGPMTKLFGVQSPDKLLGLKQQASPLSLVTAQAPPVLIVQGKQDTVVPIAQSQTLLEALQRVGGNVRMITYDGDHGFKGLTHEEYLSITQRELEFILAWTNAR